MEGSVVCFSVTVGSHVRENPGLVIVDRLLEEPARASEIFFCTLRPTSQLLYTSWSVEDQTRIEMDYPYDDLLRGGQPETSICGAFYAGLRSLTRNMGCSSLLRANGD